MTYGIFATGCMIHPLGGIIFGYIGDKISILIMAIPTLIIGFIPTFDYELDQL
ncbi:MAG: hypothetical protein U9N33_07240 [Campylobacterota bacterium]|nr:hypothetical protein [Campylobacterota bacterium]